MDLREALVLFVLDGEDELVLELHHRVEVCDRAPAAQKFSGPCCRPWRPA